MYKIEKSSRKVELVKYGNWNIDDGVSVQETNIWKRRSNLKGHQIR